MQYNDNDHFMRSMAGEVMPTVGVGQNTSQKPLIDESVLGDLGAMFSMEYGDCSIAAASLHARVGEVTDRATENLPKTKLLVPDAMMGVTPFEGNAWRVATDSATPKGRSINYTLLAGDGGMSTYLMAVTRGDIAFPVARIARRQSSQTCDYVQILGEMNDENFVVTPSDETGSRLDIVEAMREMLSGSYLSEPVAHSIDEIKTMAKSYDIADHLEFLVDQESSIPIRQMALAAFRSVSDIDWPGYSDRLVNGKNFSGKYAVLCAQANAVGRKEIRAVRDYSQAFADFFRSPSMRPEVIAKLPGVVEDHRLRQFVTIIAAKKLDVQELLHDEIGGAAERLSVLVDIDSVIEDKLGEFDPAYEKSLSYIQTFAKLATGFSVSIGNVPVGTIESEGIVDVVIEPDSATTYKVSMPARIPAMPDRPPVRFLEARIDKAGLSTLSEGEKNRLTKVIGQIARDNGLEVADAAEYVEYGVFDDTEGVGKCSVEHTVDAPAGMQNRPAARFRLNPVIYPGEFNE